MPLPPATSDLLDALEDLAEQLYSCIVHARLRLDDGDGLRARCELVALKARARRLVRLLSTPGRDDAAPPT